MAIDTIKSTAVLDGTIATADIADDAVTSAKLDTNIAVAGDLTVDTNTLHVDATNNRVGINSSSSARLTVASADSGVTPNTTGDEALFEGAGNSGITIGSGTSSSSSIYFARSTDATVGRMRYDHSTDILSFGTNGVHNRMSILSGGGLTFNGDTAAANALDDYEEGTWTPTLDAVTTSPSSPTSGNGTYTKIGNVVHAYGFISNISISGASGNATITGLPFNCNNAISSGSMPGSLYYNNFLLASANHTHAIVEVPNGNNFLYIRIMYSTSNPATVAPANTNYFVEGTTDFRFQITYQTTA